MSESNGDVELVRDSTGAYSCRGTNNERKGDPLMQSILRVYSNVALIIQSAEESSEREASTPAGKKSAGNSSDGKYARSPGVA